MAKASSHTDRKPIIYLYLYEKLIERFGRRPVEIDVKDIIATNKIIVFHIPSKHSYPIIQEMVHYGLLKKINSRKYELITKDYENIVEPIHTYFLWD